MEVDVLDVKVVSGIAIPRSFVDGFRALLDQCGMIPESYAASPDGEVRVEFAGSVSANLLAALLHGVGFDVDVFPPGEGDRFWRVDAWPAGTRAGAS